MQLHTTELEVSNETLRNSQSKHWNFLLVLIRKQFEAAVSPEIISSTDKALEWLERLWHEIKSTQILFPRRIYFVKLWIVGLIPPHPGALFFR